MDGGDSGDSFEENPPAYEAAPANEELEENDSGGGYAFDPDPQSNEE